MKIQIDDICNTIVFEEDGEEKEVNAPKVGDLERILKEVLTEKQYFNFVGVDTARTFYISNKKLTILKKYIN